MSLAACRPGPPLPASALILQGDAAGKGVKAKKGARVRKPMRRCLSVCRRQCAGRRRQRCRQWRARNIPPARNVVRCERWDDEEGAKCENSWRGLAGCVRPIRFYCAARLCRVE